MKVHGQEWRGIEVGQTFSLHLAPWGQKLLLIWFLVSSAFLFHPWADKAGGGLEMT